MTVNNKIVIYQSKGKNVELKSDLVNKTLWLTQLQVAELFDVQKAAVSRHVKNIFESDELDEKVTVSKMETVQKEGSRTVTRETEHYNLDLIISIGYRVNSKKATDFRKWATEILRTHILDGFTINRSRVQANYQKFMETIEEVKLLLPENPESFKSADALELVKLFASTWLSIDNYDKESLDLKKITKEKVALVASDLELAIEKFKHELIKKGQATHLFATDRTKKSLEGIVGNVMQSFGGNHVYKSVEEKASHLMYFIIKNHPFADGNKRSGAYSFIWYLNKNGRLDMTKVNPNVLTTLTLLVAESDPAHKEKIVKVIMKLIER